MSEQPVCVVRDLQVLTHSGLNIILRTKRSFLFPPIHILLALLLFSNFWNVQNWDSASSDAKNLAATWRKTIMNVFV